MNVGELVAKVACGDRFTCALLQNGAVRCWGVGAALGYPGQVGPVGDNETPASKGDVNVACKFLGDLYAKGELVPRDIMRANALYDKACKLGYDRGCAAKAE